MELIFPQGIIKFNYRCSQCQYSFILNWKYWDKRRQEIISIHLGPATETETDLELSVTAASPNTQHDVVVEGTLNEGVYNNKDFRLIILLVVCIQQFP